MNVSFFNTNMSKYMPKFYVRYSELQHDPSLSLPSAIQYQPGDREGEREKSHLHHIYMRGAKRLGLYTQKKKIYSKYYLTDTYPVPIAVCIFTRKCCSNLLKF